MPPTDPAALLAALTDPKTTLADVLELYQRHEADAAGTFGSVDVFRAMADRLLRNGLPYQATEIAGRGLATWPGDQALRRIRALAWARCGAPGRANEALRQLVAEGLADEETLGILARTHKDLAFAAADPAERRRQLDESFKWYRQGYELTDGYWVGVNAAAVAALKGDWPAARPLAERVLRQCLDQWETAKSQGGDHYWLLATLGEAALILGRRAEAEDWYGQARAAGGEAWGHLSTTRRQARLLLAALGEEPTSLDRLFAIPKVVVFAGHMIDRPGRETPRFPAALEPDVRRAIAEWLAATGGKVGFSSAACGSDIMFLEAVQALGGETNVILPSEEASFVRDSVDVIPGGDWGNRFSAAFAKGVHKIAASTQRIKAGGVSYDYASAVMFGLAVLRAKELDAELVGLAVWDGRGGDGPGGTASVVRCWQDFGVPVEVIRLENGAVAGVHAAGPPADAPPPIPHDDANVSVKTLLFADAVGFSKLTEEEVPLFVAQFLGGIRDLLDRSGHGPVVSNTWGDGLYMVFDGVRDAGLTALDLRDLVTGTKWEEKGLPAGLSLRIALHAGPVYACTDPVTDRLTCVGTHVSRAARIEPVTAPGQVYASQAFAALAAAEKVADFSCEFLKALPLAKAYGTFPTYIVRR